VVVGREWARVKEPGAPVFAPLELGQARSP